MLTHSRIAELTLRLSGRLARLGQNTTRAANGTSIGVGALQSAIRATALSSAPIRTTSPTNDPMARRRPLSTILHTAAVFAVAAALSGAAADVAAARGGGFGGGFGGGGHIGGIGSDFVAGSGGGFGGGHIGGFGGSPVGGIGGSHAGAGSGEPYGGFGGSPGRTGVVMSGGSGEPVSADLQGAPSGGSGAALAATSAVFLEANSITPPWQLILVALRALLL